MWVKKCVEIRHGKTGQTRLIRFDQRPDWPNPNPIRPARFAMSTNVE